MVICCKQEFVKGLKLRHGSAVIPIGQLSVGLPRHRALLFKALADACELPCRLLRGRFYTGGSEEKAVVMVRSLDQEVRHSMKTCDGINMRDRLSPLRIIRQGLFCDKRLTL